MLPYEMLDLSVDLIEEDGVLFIGEEKRKVYCLGKELKYSFLKSRNT